MAYIEHALLRATVALTGLRGRLSQERGQDLLEYALLGGLLAAAIAAAAITAIMTGALESMAQGVADCIDFDGTTPCP